MSVVWVSKEDLSYEIEQRLLPGGVVVDIGPGIQPQKLIDPQVHICVDAHRPYVERLQSEIGDDPRYMLLNCTWDVALKAMPARSVDCVFALDVIEHMEKDDGMAFLREAQRVARRQVVIFTPLGFYPQSYDDLTKPDRWGMDGGYWQTHRSGWLPDDFGDNWDIVCCRDFHTVDDDKQPLDEPIGAIWAFRHLANETASLRAATGHHRRTKSFTPRTATVAALRRILPSSAFRGLRRAWRSTLRR